MRRLSLRVLPVMAVVTLLLLAGSVIAQVATGSAVGVVADQTGAVIAGASVTAKNKATGVEKTVTTNDRGEYEIAPLQPGEYEITVDANGFTKTVNQTATVNVGTRASYNFALKPAGAEATVVVEGEAGATIETTNTVVQGVVDNRQLADLPLPGRTFSNVAILIPGAKPAGAFDPTKARTGTISLAGSTGRDANVSVDGADDKDNVVGGVLQNYTTEGIQEFVVQTQNFLPDTGRSAGGVITVVTKGGTNELHGSFVLFERNDRTNARAFNNQEPAEKQPFDRQNIAGSLGFPIIKDKFFFFGAAEYTRENISVVIDPSAVNQLKALDVFAKRGEIPGVSSVAALSTIPTPFRDTQFQIRTDLKWSNKQLMTFRYGHQTNNLDNDEITNLADVTQGAKTTNELRSALFSDTYTFNNSVVNVFTFQFSKFINRINGKTDAVQLTFPSGVAFGRNTNVPQSTLQDKFQFKDAVSIIRGRHSLKFGFDYVFVPLIGGTFDFFSTPTFEFNTDPTDILAQGAKLSATDSKGNVLFVDDVLLADGNSRVDQRVDQLSAYGQDSFRVNRKFTFNYGVRYDVDFGFYDGKRATQETNRAVIALQKIGMLPKGKGALPSDDTNNVSPRVGFAYDPKGDGKAVIRASYGIFYDQIFQNVQFFGLQQAGPSIYALQVFNPLRIGIDPTPPRTGFLPDIPVGVGQGRAIDPHIVTPYSQQASVNFQYEFAPGYVFDTQYIHILGLHEFVNVELNPKIGPLDPDFTFGKKEPRLLTANFVAAGIGPFSRFRYASSINRSRYDGFTVGVNKRYTGTGRFKYQYGLHYTLSRSLAYGNAAVTLRNDFFFTFEDPFNLFRSIDFGRTNEDARHRAVFNGLVDMPLGFQVSTIIQAESGRRFGITADQDLNGDGNTFSDFARVDSQGNFIVFQPGQAITGRPIGVTAGAGVPYFQVDMRITKKFQFKERVKVEGYVEFFNLFNRANVGNVFGDPTNGPSGSVLASIPAGKDASGNVVTRSPVNVRDFLPTGLLGSSFGGAGATVGLPFSAQFGFRVSF